MKNLRETRDKLHTKNFLENAWGTRARWYVHVYVVKHSTPISPIALRPFYHTSLRKVW